MRTVLVLVAIFASAFANPKYPDTCGLENKPLMDSKIVGGQEAARHQFPWLASVSTNVACTGSILDENWIITAQHCINPNGGAEIRVGAHSIAYGADEPYMQPRKSSEIHISPNGDFALIKLDIPLELNEYVRPVCLPTRAEANDTFFWRISDHNRMGWPENIICTDANQGMAVCFGDSGGPLNYEMEDGKYMQIGVNQFVTSLTCVGGINGYARLLSHLDFIQEITGMVIE
ncbi:unnamed protein product [Lepeophtheirus salmonis]|uniref:(salmon louse) hypothetical protein n=1 Tax=Lepeophtheirus salmonis TaxID=72036 RepID=A0A7R8H4R6_LEPSM|nr:unnamed protein product [Lepeophtheirus salmonis]CAF2867483.1 unnamed protein product [Lepeophtheirus salmonis]